MRCKTHPDVEPVVVCPACLGAAGGASKSPAKLRALAENRKKRWPKKKARTRS